MTKYPTYRESLQSCPPYFDPWGWFLTIRLLLFTISLLPGTIRLTFKFMREIEKLARR